MSVQGRPQQSGRQHGDALAINDDGVRPASGPDSTPDVTETQDLDRLLKLMIAGHKPV